jgi:hypothetical protein
MASDRGLLIAGEQQESSTGETYDDVNPYTGDAIATVAAASPSTRPGRSTPPPQRSRPGRRPRPRNAGPYSCVPPSW